MDKDTTGLIVVAKTDEAHQSLVHQFASRLIRRTYTALIWGSPQKMHFKSTLRLVEVEEIEKKWLWLIPVEKRP